jgi:hypothetical protein
MATFNLTKKRLTALDLALDAMGAQDAATLDFEAGVLEMRRLGFKAAHFVSRGKGGAGEPGEAYDATMDRGAARLFNQEEKALWTSQEKGEALSKLKRRAANYVFRIKTHLEKLEAETAAKGKGKADAKGGAKGKTKGKTKDAREIDLDAIAKRRSVIENCLKADTDARKQTLAEYGGEAQAKTFLAAWDVLRAAYGSK